MLPDPPQEPDPRPFYRRGWFVVLAVGVAALLLGVFSDDGRTRTGTAAALSETGDWPSEAAYRTDIQDTTERMADLLGTVSDMSIDVANGAMSLAQYSALMDDPIESVRSHRDYFRGTSAPQGFATTHEHLNTALDLYVESFETIQRGADTDNASLIAAGVELMSQAAEAIETATAALPQ